ncbi:MAG TPA: hypothetical protein VGK96_21770 [Candidatus Sulfotelmatobacter sp.]
MHRTSGMIAVMLLVVMAGAFPGAHALVFLTMQPAHPAGCHGHGPATPVPAPTSFQCCVSGHQAAMPNASFSPGALAVGLCALAAAKQVSPGFALDRLPAMLIVPSNSPPGAAPLRI